MLYKGVGHWGSSQKVAASLGQGIWCVSIPVQISVLKTERSIFPTQMGPSELSSRESALVSPYPGWLGRLLWVPCPGQPPGAPDHACETCEMVLGWRWTLGWIHSQLNHFLVQDVTSLLALCLAKRLQRAFIY